jgi:CRP-like cAMP-binding protein
MPERLCDGPGHLLPLRHLMIGFLQGISLTERLIISNVPEKNVWREFFSPLTQETIEETIGTTRSRVSLIMNRLRQLGFIGYDGRIQVHKSLLDVVLLDQLPEHHAKKPRIASVT